MDLTAIFFDLDDTLIHTRVTEEGLDAGMSAPTPFGPYQAWVRPMATRLLQVARSFEVPVFLCTTSERRYAAGLSTLFGLGFSENMILGFEHLTAGKANLAPKGVLIDDLAPDHDIAVLKQRVLGITRERYLQLPAYCGQAAEAETEVAQLLEAFLKRFTSK